MKKMRLQPKLLFGLLIMAVVLMLALTPTISGSKTSMAMRSCLPQIMSTRGSGET